VFFTRYCLVSQSKEDEMSRGQKRGTYRVLVAKPEGKRPLGRSRHRCILKK